MFVVQGESVLKIIVLAAAAAAAAGGAAMAQPSAGPSDPAAPVPASVHRSVFEGLPAGVEQEQLDWREANADVARFARGHADYVKWEEQQLGGAPAPSAGIAPPAGATPPARQQGHRHH